MAPQKSKKNKTAAAKEKQNRAAGEVAQMPKGKAAKNSKTTTTPDDSKPGKAAAKPKKNPGRRMTELERLQQYSREIGALNYESPEPVVKPGVKRKRLGEDEGKSDVESDVETEAESEADQPPVVPEAPPRRILRDRTRTPAPAPAPVEKVKVKVKVVAKPKKDKPKPKPNEQNPVRLRLGDEEEEELTPYPSPDIASSVSSSSTGLLSAPSSSLLGEGAGPPGRLDDPLLYFDGNYGASNTVNAHRDQDRHALLLGPPPAFQMLERQYGREMWYSDELSRYVAQVVPDVGARLEGWAARFEGVERQARDLAGSVGAEVLRAPFEVDAGLYRKQADVFRVWREYIEVLEEVEKARARRGVDDRDEYEVKKALLGRVKESRRRFQAEYDQLLKLRGHAERAWWLVRAEVMSGGVGEGQLGVGVGQSVQMVKKHKLKGGDQGPRKDLRCEREEDKTAGEYSLERMAGFVKNFAQHDAQILYQHVETDRLVRIGAGRMWDNGHMPVEAYEALEPLMAAVEKYKRDGLGKGDASLTTEQKENRVLHLEAFRRRDDPWRRHADVTDPPPGWHESSERKTTAATHSPATAYSHALHDSNEDGDIVTSLDHHKQLTTEQGLAAGGSARPANDNDQLESERQDDAHNEYQDGPTEDDDDDSENDPMTQAWKDIEQKAQAAFKKHGPVSIPKELEEVLKKGTFKETAKANPFALTGQGTAVALAGATTSRVAPTEEEGKGATKDKGKGKKKRKRAG